MDNLPEMTPEDLEKNNGVNGAKTYIAYKGRVYDVSESDMWDDGDHLGSHTAGEDLTDSMEDAPHDDDVLLDRFPVVGTIKQG